MKHITFYKTEYLQQLNLIDINAREIKTKDRVEVRCCKCQKITSLQKLEVLIRRFNKYGYSWECSICNQDRKTSSIHKHWANSDKKSESLRKYQSTMQSRYGSNNYQTSKEAQDRRDFIEATRKTTLIKRYGTDNIQKIASATEKRRKTCKDRYGNENMFKTTHFKEVRRATWMKKYKVNHILQSDEYAIKHLNDPARFTSKAEKEIRQFVESLGLTARKMRHNGLEIDIYIEELKIGIEYNGLYWHSEADAKKAGDYKVHLKKTQHFESIGIRLIQIFEHEWAAKRLQVCSFLRSVFNKNDYVIGARSCIIKEIDKKTAKTITNEIHIQGAPRQIIKAFGLEYNNEIIALAIFGPHPRRSQVITLSRFVVKSGYSVPGALSRLSKYASQYFKQNIFSWCDRRWSIGSSYLQAGWSLHGVLPVDYFYYNIKTREIMTKISRRKSALGTPQDLTERQHALQDGFYRVYDCGKIRFIYKYQK